MAQDSHETRRARREFLAQGTVVLLAAGRQVKGAQSWAQEPAKTRCRFAVLTDLHYADRPPAGNRYYRETIEKLREAVGHFQQQRPDFAVELGDLIDAADTPEEELQYLRTVNAVFTEAAAQRHYVLGNHCVYTLTKDEFLGEVGKKQAHYSFDCNGLHFVILDCCFRSDGEPYGRKNAEWTDSNLPADQLAWLEADLAKSDSPTIVFTHQRLDVSNNYGVRNCPQIRQVLEKSKRVLAVFQGHSHKNDYQKIGDIHYCTLVAMVEGTGKESSAYATVEVLADDTIVVHGQRKQRDYRWS